MNRIILIMNWQSIHDNDRVRDRCRCHSVSMSRPLVEWRRQRNSAFLRYRMQAISAWMSAVIYIWPAALRAKICAPKTFSRLIYMVRFSARKNKTMKAILFEIVDWEKWIYYTHIGHTKHKRTYTRTHAQTEANYFKLISRIRLVKRSKRIKFVFLDGPWSNLSYCGC